MERRTFLKAAGLSLTGLLLGFEIKPQGLPDKDALEREATITLQVGDLKFTYFGSGIKTRVDQIIFSDAYQQLPEGKIIGHYNFVHFAFSDPNLARFEINNKTKPHFKTRAQDIYPNSDYYNGSGLLTVFSQEYSKLIVKKYTFEPTLPIPALFYPKKREFFDAWEVVETAYNMRKGNRVSNPIKNLPLVIDLEKTLAYIYESFPLQIY